MTAPRVATAKPSEAVVNPERDGRAARQDFWRKMTFPLFAFLLASSSQTALNWVLGVVFAFYLMSLCYCFFKKDDWFRSSVQSPSGFALQVIGFFALQMYLLKMRLNRNSDSHSSEWEGVMFSVALTYIILIYCLSTSRQRECPIPWVFYILMFCTKVFLYSATRVELVNIESLVVFFKTASLVAILCCMPHLYPGLNPRRSTAVVKSFFLVILPLALLGIWMLMKYDMTSNDMIIAKVDGYKHNIVAVCLLLDFFEGIFEAMNEIDEEMKLDSMV